MGEGFRKINRNHYTYMGYDIRRDKGAGWAIYLGGRLLTQGQRSAQSAASWIQGRESS